MSVELATAYVTVIPTTKGIAAGLEKELVGPLEDAGKKGGKKAGDAASAEIRKTGETLTKFGIGALAVAGAVGVGLFKAGDAASDLGESINAVQVTFGKAAGGILKLGEDAATTMGLSNAAFNGLAVQFSAFATTIAGKGGDVVATMKDLTGRAADFASVMNIDVKDAATLFQSGLAGETEPLRKYGIDLSAAAVKAFAAAHGIGTLGKELTEAEKVTARYGLLMESTSKNQGDFANTSDSAANAMRIAKAEMENATASLGASLAPAMAFAAQKVSGLAKGFAGLNEATDGWIGKGAGIAAVALGAAGGLSFLVGQGIKMKERFSDLKAVFVDTEGGLTKMGSAAKSLVGPLAVLGVVAVGLYLRSQHAADALKNITKNAEELERVSDRDVLNVLNKSIAQGVANGVGLEETMQTLAHASIEGAKRSLEMAEANGTNQKVVDALRAAILEEERAVAQQAKTTEDAATAADGAADSTENLTGETDLLTNATKFADAVIKGIAAATDEAKRKSDAFADSLRTQRERLEEAYGIERSAIQAKHDFADSTKQANDDLAALTETLKTNKEGSEEAVTATDAAAASILKASEDYATLNGAAINSDAATRRQIDALNQQAAALAPGNPLRARLLEYIAELNRVQQDIQTRLVLNISVGSVSTAAGDAIGYGVVHGAGGSVPHARGGAASGRILVGEEGPEYLDVPAGSFVHTAQATNAMRSAQASMTSVGAGSGVAIETLQLVTSDPPKRWFDEAMWRIAS